MDKNAIIAELAAAGIEEYKLRAPKLDNVITQIEAIIGAKDRQIAWLKEALDRRKRKRQVRINAKPGRRRGRPSKYDSDWDYYWYWLWHEKHVFGTNWLTDVMVNRDGYPMTDGERTHIKKILSSMTPGHIKAFRKSRRRTDDTGLGHIPDDY